MPFKCRTQSCTEFLHGVKGVFLKKIGGMADMVLGFAIEMQDTELH